MSPLLCHVLLGAAWAVWFYPYLFQAPHRQQRANITVATPTRIGLLLECTGIFIALAMHVPRSLPVPPVRFAAAAVLAGIAIWMAFTSVRHLGKQFRLYAGLYHDHQLVRTGPYAVVRHPIYASLLTMLLATICILTPWNWAALSIAVYIVGTEFRVRAEDRLLSSRFGAEFQSYKSKVPAYIPFVR